MELSLVSNTKFKAKMSIAEIASLVNQPALDFDKFLQDDTAIPTLVNIICDRAEQDLRIGFADSYSTVDCSLEIFRIGSNITFIITSSRAFSTTNSPGFGVAEQSVVKDFNPAPNEGLEVIFGDGFDDMFDPEFTLDPPEDEEEEEESPSYSGPTTLFFFSDFEYIIAVAHRLHYHDIAEGSVYHHDNRYYYAIPHRVLGDLSVDELRAILSEYGLPSNRTVHYLREYGKPIFESGATNAISRKFCK